MNKGLKPNNLAYGDGLILAVRKKDLMNKGLL